MKTNSERSEYTVKLDAAYWLPKVNRELFTWLDDEGKSKVRACDPQRISTIFLPAGDL